MSDLIRLERRISYLENQLSTAKVTPAVTPEVHIVEKVVPADEEKIKSLEAEIAILKDKLNNLEQNFSSMLDRVLTLKEKIEPSFDVSVLESRVISLEEVTQSLVGMGRS